MVDNKDFEDFDYNLQFIDKYMDTLVPSGIAVDNSSLIGLAVLSAFYSSGEGSLPSDLRNLRLSLPQKKAFSIEVNYAHSQNAARLQVRGSITVKGQHRYLLSLSTNTSDQEDQEQVIFDDEEVTVRWSGDQVEVEAEGRKEVLSFYQDAGLGLNIFDAKGTCFNSKNLLDQIQRVKEEKIDTERISAPMSGMVVKLNVTEGDTVEKGKVVAIMEAMKMEQLVVAPIDLTVGKVFATEQKFIQAGDPLMKIEPVVKEE